MKHLSKALCAMLIAGVSLCTLGGCGFLLGDDKKEDSSITSSVGGGDVTSEETGSSEQPGGGESSVEETAPSAPVIAMDENHKISWAAVEGATSYIVNVNGVDGEPQEDLFFQGSEEIGAYALKVKAVNAVGAGEYSEEITYEFLAVTEPTAVGVIFEGAAKVEKGKAYSFTIECAENYDDNFTVTVNGEAVTATEGVYTVENAQEALVIVVEGVQLKTFAVTVEGDNVTYNGSETVTYGDDLEFTITVADGYAGAAVMVGETMLTPDADGNYIIENVQEDLTISVIAYTLAQKLYLASNWTTGGTIVSGLDSMKVDGAWRLVLNKDYINEVLAAGYDVLEFDISVSGNCAFLQDDRGMFLDLDENKVAHVTLNLTQDMSYTVRGKKVFGTGYESDIDAANHVVSNATLSKAAPNELEQTFYATGADKAFTVSGTASATLAYGGLYVKDTWQATLNAAYVNALLDRGFKYLEFDLAVGGGCYIIQDSYNYFYEQNENGWVHIGLRLTRDESFVFRGKTKAGGGYGDNTGAFAFVVKNVTVGETADTFDMTDSLSHFAGASYYTNLNRAYINGAWRVVIRNDSYIQSLIDAGYKTLSFKVKVVDLGNADSFVATKLTFANVNPVGYSGEVALDGEQTVVLTYNLADMVGKDAQFRGATDEKGSGAHKYWIDNIVLAK